MSSETEIIQQAAAAFIRDRYRLGAFVGGLLRDAHAAEDVIQEVWVRLAAELEKGTVLGNQAAWCRGVAKNLIRRHWERQKTGKVIANSEMMEKFLDQVAEAFDESDEMSEHWAERQRALDECVSALPKRSRRMLSLRYESGSSVDEVARTLGMGFDGVTKSLYRLRKSLGKCVERKLIRNGVGI